MSKANIVLVYTLTSVHWFSREVTTYPLVYSHEETASAVKDCLNRDRSLFTLLTSLYAVDKSEAELIDEGRCIIDRQVFRIIRTPPDEQICRYAMTKLTAREAAAVRNVLTNPSSN